MRRLIKTETILSTQFGDEIIKPMSQWMVKNSSDKNRLHIKETEQNLRCQKDNWRFVNIEINLFF